MRCNASVSPSSWNSVRKTPEPSRKTTHFLGTFFFIFSPPPSAVFSLDLKPKFDQRLCTRLLCGLRTNIVSETLFWLIKKVIMLYIVFAFEIKPRVWVANSSRVQSVYVIVPPLVGGYKPADSSPFEPISFDSLHHEWPADFRNKHFFRP